MTNDEGMPNDGCKTFRHLGFVINSSSVIRISSFLIHIALVAFLILEFLNVFIGLLDALAALLVHDFAQRSIDVLGHPTRIAAHEKVSALGVDPIPNFSSVLRHL